MPDVAGEEAEVATDEVEGAGLEAAYEEEPEDPALCTVTDQDQAPGDEIEEGETVTLTLECQVEVPELSGFSADEAEVNLRDLELEPAYETDPSDPTVCTVSEQDPVSGEPLDPGELVTLTLACEVPDMTGMDAESASGELESAGYSVTFDAFHFLPDDPSACMVDSQDPTSDAEPGAEIELQLSCPEDDY